MNTFLKYLGRLVSYIVTALLFFWFGSGLKQYSILDYHPYAPSDDPSGFKYDKDNLVAMLRNHSGVFVTEEPDSHDVMELAKCFWAMSFAIPDRAIEMTVIEGQILEFGVRSAKSKSDKEWLQQNLDVSRSYLQQLRQKRRSQEKSSVLPHQSNGESSSNGTQSESHEPQTQ